MPQLASVTTSVLVILTLAYCCSVSASSTASSRRLLNIQARVPDSTAMLAASKPDSTALLYECFCISTYPYIKKEKRFMQTAETSDVRAGKVPTCPAGGWQPGSAQYGSTGCKLVKGQLD
jgi:hypothetical protein